MEKHHTATVLIVTKEEPRRVLMVYHQKFRAWLPPGGHVEPHENPLEAAAREVQEETGLDISDALPRPVRLDGRVISLPLPFRILEEPIEAHGDKPAHYHIDQIYVVHTPFQEVTHSEPGSGPARWISKNEIDGLETFENCRMILRGVLNA